LVFFAGDGSSLLHPANTTTDKITRVVKIFVVFISFGFKPQMDFRGKTKVTHLQPVWITQRHALFTLFTH
jgi:hypothetical protein